MKTFKTFIAVAVVMMMVTVGVSAQEQNAEELMKQAHLNLYYAGDDGIAEVTMKIVNSKGKERLREFSMLRLDLADGGRQNYYTYFKQPHDVSRLTFMVHKMPQETDNRWLYVPSVDLVKRISADDKNSSFVGSDFTYEDVSGRHWTEDNHNLLGEDTLNGRTVYKVESVPKQEYKGFARKVTYIDKGYMLPVREEYYDKKNELERVFTAEKIENIDGIPTPTMRKIENVQKEQFTTVEFTDIDYNINFKEDIFTERYLKNPPREYIK